MSFGSFDTGEHVPADMKASISILEFLTSVRATNQSMVGARWEINKAAAEPTA